MSNRKITDEQFSTDSTIDGSRIAKAVSDVVNYNNDLPLEAVARSRSLSCICLGAYPRKHNAAAGALSHSPPWMWYSWEDTTVTPNVKHYRAKGVQAATKTDGTLLVDDGGVWTTSAIFDRPVIIDTVCVHIEHINILWPIEFSYAGGPKPTDDVSLLQLLIDTDDLTAPEDRTLNAKELHYFNFDPKVHDARCLNQNTPANDMFPVPPIDARQGANGVPSMLLEKRSLNIPVHQFARVRFRLAFASDKGTSANYSWASGAPHTMHPGQPTFIIFFREQLRV
tara:strand:- start:11291 stop:12136 length:846 start_codon:yes stop_codon:yes gene_type:complete